MPPTQNADFDEESGDAAEALRQANDVNLLLSDLAQSPRWGGNNAPEQIKEALLRMAPDELAEWERGYREHVAVPSTGTLTAEEQALVDQYDGYEEAAEALRILRGQRPARAARPATPPAAAVNAVPRQAPSAASAPQQAPPTAPTVQQAPNQIANAVHAPQDATAQLSDMFGEFGQRVKQGLTYAYRRFDPDVVDGVIAVELSFVGVTNPEEVRAAIGALRDVTDITPPDMRPNQQERAFLKKIATEKLVFTRALSEVAQVLEKWKIAEDAEFVAEYVPAVMDELASQLRGRLGRLVRGQYAIDKKELTAALNATLRGASDRRGVERFLKAALKRAPETMRTEIFQQLELYLTGDDMVRGTRAYRMKQNIAEYRAARPGSTRAR